MTVGELTAILAELDDGAIVMIYDTYDGSLGTAREVRLDSDKVIIEA